jgi:hypothetical protein
MADRLAYSNNTAIFAAAPGSGRASELRRLAVGLLFSADSRRRPWVVVAS